MTKPILTQILGVSQRRDDRGVEGLIYAPAPLLGEVRPAPESAWRQIKSDVLARHVERIRNRVEELTWRARLAKSRDDTGIESEANALASYILPERGFLSVVEPGLNPQFDIVYDAASAIPWEVLEERYAVCRCRADLVCFCLPSDLRTSPQPIYCRFCGEEMDQRGGKLVVERHLTHLVRGGKQPSGEGNEFLIVEDPTRDLCVPDTDPQGRCREHLVELTRLLAGHGYRVNVLRGKNATGRRLSSALSDPAVVGLYYFGHGFFPQDGDQGCLLLADGPMYASEIEQLNPNVRFVFLNACEGAVSGRSWSLERKFRSVGHALARGGPSKAVIAPLWPVIGAQAAGAALDFFRAALAGERLGAALHVARRTSLADYERGLPEISWMAYRYFGDPNRKLPPPSEAAGKQIPVAGVPASCRIFDEENRLDVDIFNFDINSVLLRAVKRRTLQHRRLISCADVLAGLIRTGNLTRFALRSVHVNPDKLYEHILQRSEREESVLPDLKASSREDKQRREQKPVEKSEGDRHLRLLRLIDQWIVRDRDRFHERLLQVLAKASQRSRERGSDHVAEEDVLVSLIDQGKWIAVDHDVMPPADNILRWLESPQCKLAVDENGCLHMHHLTPLARRVIENAHELAQQRGAREIPNRLMLAAFLNESDGHAATVCRSRGINVRPVSAFLIASTDSKSPSTFVLSPEACQRVILPMLRRARQLRGQRQQKVTTETLLFESFCEIASVEFKQMLRKLPGPLSIDLDEIWTGEPRWAKSSEPGKSPAVECHANSTCVSAGDGVDIGKGDAPQSASPRKSVQSPNAGDQSVADQLTYRFEPTVKRALVAAINCGMSQGSSEIRSVHLFIGLVSHCSAAMTQRLRSHGVRPEQLCVAMLRLVRPKMLESTNATRPAVSCNTQAILDRAESTARSDGRLAISECDLWDAIMKNRKGIVVQALIELGLEGLVHEDCSQLPCPRDQVVAKLPSVRSALPLLTSDLTAKFQTNPLPATASRNRELDALVKVLVSSPNGNVLLVGSCSAGKTALAAGLADWIVDGICPECLRDKRVLEISGYGLVNATRFDDEAVGRLCAILEEADSSAILFFDDLDAIFQPQFIQHQTAAFSDGFERLINDQHRVLIAATTPDGQQRLERTAADWFKVFQVQVIEPLESVQSGEFEDE